MATKKNNSDLAVTALFGAALFVIFIPFLIFTFAHYKHLKNKFPLTESSQRIFDFGKLLPALTKGSSAVFIIGFSILQVSQRENFYLLISVIVIAGAWVCYYNAKSIASEYFGVIIDPIRDVIVLPKDMANYGIGDYLNLRFIRELGLMEEVKLSKVTKITRKAGTVLYIHGSFGSRGIIFSNKQKRDECIAAIENGCEEYLTLMEFEEV